VGQTIVCQGLAIRVVDMRFAVRVDRRAPPPGMTYPVVDAEFARRSPPPAHELRVWEVMIYHWRDTGYKAAATPGSLPTRGAALALATKIPDEGPTAAGGNLTMLRAGGSV
jgi:hypothetical protein